MKSLFLIGFIICTISCTHVQPLKTTVHLSKYVHFILPKLDLWGPDRIVRQLLTIERNREKRSFEVILKKSNEELKIIALTPLGIQLFSMSYKDDKVRISQKLNEIKLKYIKYALADIALIYTPSSQVENYLLGSDVSLKKGFRYRQVFFGKKRIIDIRYSGDNMLKCDISYENFLRNYKMKIKNIRVQLL